MKLPLLFDRILHAFCIFASQMKKQNSILILIVLAQFCCTSLWFAGNAVLNDLVSTFHLNSNALKSLTSAVQFGFITGTFLFAFYTIVDRFSPAKVFFICALLGAIFNSFLIFDSNTPIRLLSFRFLTGFFLAGIYPVGMKIATDYFQQGLGTSLSFLVGALVLGTALPHLLKNNMHAFPWQTILLCISILAVFGGLLVLLFVPDGPFRKKGRNINKQAYFKIFQKVDFKNAAFGYFGHMWELYTFWTFVPVFLKTYSDWNAKVSFNIPLLTFYIIGIGSISCILGSFLAKKYGTQQVAFITLFLSSICCLCAPLFFMFANKFIFICFLFFWGMVVIADSPLLSTLVAKSAPEKERGTALTIVNCIGFAITIVSIQLLSSFQEATNSPLVFALLAIGPIVGMYSLKVKKKIGTKNETNVQKI
jgi:MFS family permease